MPTSNAKGSAETDRRGKSPATQAGEFVREQSDHVHERKHGVSGVSDRAA